MKKSSEKDTRRPRHYAKEMSYIPEGKRAEYAKRIPKEYLPIVRSHMRRFKNGPQ